MGNHYVPQKYLLRFSEEDRGIWVYDREKATNFRTGVRKIAHEINMYSPEVESNLNEQVEIPTHEVFDKIVAQRQLSDADRKALAKYIVVMWKRVPTGRERAMTRLPNVADEVHDDLMKELDGLIMADPSFRARGEKVRSEAKTIIANVKASPSPSLWYESFNLTDESGVEQALLSMNWVFLHSAKVQYLTSDNPVFFFAHEGIGSSSSELTFPISESIALWATRHPRQNGLHAPALPAGVKQINRRTASNSKRFVFAKTNESWIMPFVTKAKWELSRLG